MLRTMTISHLHATTFILQTCHPKNVPISQMPPCSAPLIDLWRRWYILTYIRKPLIWRSHIGSLFTQHGSRRRQWHGRTLLNSISWWWFLDGRICSRETLVHTWWCSIWSVPLSMSIQFKSATPHPWGHHAVHRSHWHLWISWCYLPIMMAYPVWKISSNSEEDTNDSYTSCLIKTLEPPVICCWLRTHLWIVTHPCTIQISTRTCLSLTIRCLMRSWKLTLFRKNTVPVTLLLYILGIFRRTLFQCKTLDTVQEHWKLFQCKTLILYKNIENCSSVKPWILCKNIEICSGANLGYCTRTLKAVPVWNFNTEQEHCKQFQCKPWILCKSTENCSSAKL